MGYSFYSPRIMFGFADNDPSDRFLSSTWVNDNYRNVYCYAGEINKGYNIFNIVGIMANMSEDGTLSYKKDEYNTLLKLKKAYEAYHNIEVELGYMMAISGDYEVEETYTLDD